MKKETPRYSECFEVCLHVKMCACSIKRDIFGERVNVEKLVLHNSQC